MDSLASQLADTAPTWSQEIAPLVEWFAETISSSTSGDGRLRVPGTRLTQRRRYEGQGGSLSAPKEAASQNSIAEIAALRFPVAASIAMLAHWRNRVSGSQRCKSSGESPPLARHL